MASPVATLLPACSEVRQGFKGSAFIAASKVEEERFGITHLCGYLTIRYCQNQDEKRFKDLQDSKTAF